MSSGNQANPGNRMVSNPGPLALRPTLSDGLPFFTLLLVRIGQYRRKLECA